MRVRRVHLRVAVGGRIAEATTTLVDDEALAALVRSVLDAAALQPVDPGWPGLAPTAEALAVDHWDDATAAAEPAERAERVDAFVRAAGGLETAGFCSTEGVEVAFANSAGQRLTGRTTSAELDGIARTGTSDGSGRAASVSTGRPGRDRGRRRGRAPRARRRRARPTWSRARTRSS